MNTRFMYTRDAPIRALGYLTSQAMRIERQVYEVRYADIQYPNLVPVDTSGPEWITGVTYFSSDAVGRANWFHAKADDVPHAEVLREKFESIVGMAAIGYDYDLEELGQAMMWNQDLRNDKANAARRASEEMIDRVAMFGDATKNFLGLLNQTSVTAGSATADGTGSSALWSAKTPDQILRDVNDVLTGQFTGTFGAEMANTLILPYQRLTSISTRRIDTTNQTTILQWLETNNVMSRQTGQPLLIRGMWGADTAGAGSTARMVAYRRSPEVLVMQIPMPFRFLPAWQQGPLRFEVPGIMRLGGVDVRRPAAMRYLDGI